MVSLLPLPHQFFLTVLCFHPSSILFLASLKLLCLSKVCPALFWSHFSVYAIMIPFRAKTEEFLHFFLDWEQRPELRDQLSEIRGKASQAHIVTGMGTAPPLVKNEPFLQGERRHRCAFCERTFNTRYACEKHEQVHTGKKSFECKHCGEAFCLMPHLIKHQKARCSRNFPGRSAHGKQVGPCGPRQIPREEKHHNEQLVQHKSATALVPRLPHSNTYIIRYTQSHNFVGRRDCQCYHCGRTFTQKSYLIQHYRVHSQEKPYQCQLCGKCYSQPSRLTEHYQFHFSKET